VLSLFGLSFPNFALGPILILLFSIRAWLAPGFRLRQFCSHGPFQQSPWEERWPQFFTRMVRTSMLEELGQDYIRTARAKRIVGAGSGLDRHASTQCAGAGAYRRRSAVPPQLLAGAIVTENNFLQVLGVGRLVIHGDRQSRLFFGTGLHTYNRVNLCRS
jgi:peptide/nickel transport system permease protein